MTGNRFKRGMAAAGGQPVDPDALARFTAGADAHETVPDTAPLAADVPIKVIPVPEYDQGGKLSEAVLFRCTSAVFQELDFVFKHSTAKSKQKLLESILLPRLKEMSREIKGGE